MLKGWAIKVFPGNRFGSLLTAWMAKGRAPRITWKIKLEIEIFIILLGVYGILMNFELLTIVYEY